MLCVLILYIIGGIYSLKSTLNDRFFEKLFMAISQQEIAKGLLFVFCFDVWPRAQTLALRLISEHIIY